MCMPSIRQARSPALLEVFPAALTFSYVGSYFFDVWPEASKGTDFGAALALYVRMLLCQACGLVHP